MLTSQTQDHGDQKSANESSSQDPRTPRSQPENLIAGIINESGTVVDDSGRAVARIADDLPLSSLVGHVVTTSGDILGDSGDVLGHALPLEKILNSQLKSATQVKEQDEPRGGLLSGLGGTVKGVTGVVGDTVNTVNTLLPVSKQLSSAVGGLEGLTGNGKSNEEETQITAPEVPKDSEVADKSDVVDEERLKDMAEEQKRAQENAGDAVDGESESKNVEKDANNTDADKDVDTNSGELVRTRQMEESSDDVTDSTINLHDRENEDEEDDDGNALEGNEATKAIEGDNKTEMKEIEPVNEEEAKKDNTEEKKENVEEEKDNVEEKKEDIKEKKADVDEKEADVNEAKADVDKKDEDSTDNEDANKDVENKTDNATETKEGATDETADKAKDAKDDVLGEQPDETTDEATKDKDNLEGKKDDATKDDNEEQSTLGSVKSRVADLGSKAEDLSSKAPDADDAKPDDTKSQADLPEESVAPEDAVSQVNLPPPFEQFPDAHVVEDGRIVAGEGSKAETVGQIAEGEDAEKLVGATVDAEGNIVNETGTVIGQAELKDSIRQELEEEARKKRDEDAENDATAAAKADMDLLKDGKINKRGNVVDKQGNVVGRVVEGILTKCIGRKTNEKGEIFDDAGKVIGRVESIPEKEREEFKAPSPFEDFEGATVESDGRVMHNGEQVGRVIEGDAKQLKGKKVDPDGDICDHSGNVIGKAERYEVEPEAEPEPEVKDQSALAGKRVNKAGNVVDSHGTIFGKLVEGNAKELTGRMCDREGNVRSESGDIIGRAEVLPEGQRESKKDGPFAELDGCVVAKGGLVKTAAGDVVGKLTSGDEKILVGRNVDEDGDVLDRNGNSIGHAERYEEPEAEPEPEREHGAMFGRKVNREGNVVSADGDVIGKLTTGEVSICAGKTVDDDGDVVDSKGNTVGHVSLLADVPPTPAPEETPDEKAKREEVEQDAKLAKQMAAAVEGCLEKIRPICKNITEKINAAERKPKEELDEEELVKQVRPLIEEGGKILNEANGVIRALDPDGHVAANAKAKSRTREATKEEYALAEVLKELTGTVTETIDNAKRKIEDMPHAKEQLNPLWGLLTEPLFQILAAVGLLLNGVLELVGRLLNGLGLGGIVNNLLGGLGLTNVLKGLGVGGVVDALTGKKKSGGGDKKKLGILGL